MAMWLISTVTLSIGPHSNEKEKEIKKDEKKKERSSKFDVSQVIAQSLKKVPSFQVINNLLQLLKLVHVQFLHSFIVQQSQS